MAEKAIDQFNFLKNCPNVRLNFPVSKVEDIHWFELTYFYNIFTHLMRWEEFNDYSFKLVSATRSLEFEITEKDIIFLTSNEDHTIREDLKKAGLIATPFSPLGNACPSNVLSIPLGANGSVSFSEIKPISERKTDVYFRGQVNKGRIPFWIGGNLLKMAKKTRDFWSDKKIKIHFNRGFATGVLPEVYAKEISDTKIALVPEGQQSVISHRFFEAARLGNIIISCELPNFWHYKPFSGIIIRNWLTLPKVVKELLNNRERMEKLHLETLEYYRDYCDESSIAQHLIKVIKEHKIQKIT